MAELKAGFPDDGLEFVLVQGGGGVFDVHLDGKLVYSKHDEDGFPRYQEIPNRFLRMM